MYKIDHDRGIFVFNIHNITGYESSLPGVTVFVTPSLLLKYFFLSIMGLNCDNNFYILHDNYDGVMIPLVQNSRFSVI